MLEHRGVPQASPTVAAVDVDGEVVLFDSRTGSTHVLDPIAAIVWSCLDGETSATDLIRDLSDEFKADPDVIAADVSTMLERLDAEGLLLHLPPGTEAKAVSVAVESAGVRFLEDSCSPCMSKLDALEWPAQTTYDTGGGLQLGVRCSTVEADQVLRRALARYIVDGGEAPPNYSVAIGAREGRSPAVHTLYRAWVARVRTRSIRRVLRAAIDQLAANTNPPPDGVVVLDACAVVGKRGAVIGPSWLRQDMAGFAGALRTEKLTLVDNFVAFVDAATAELVVPETPLDIDWDAIDSLDDPGKTDAGVAPGRYPLQAVAFFEPGPDRSATAVAGAAALLKGTAPADASASLTGLADLLARVQVVTVPPDRRAATAALANAANATGRRP